MQRAAAVYIGGCSNVNTPNVKRCFFTLCLATCLNLLLNLIEHETATEL